MKKTLITLAVATALIFPASKSFAFTSSHVSVHTSTHTSFRSSSSISRSSTSSLSRSSVSSSYRSSSSSKVGSGTVKTLPSNVTKTAKYTKLPSIGSGKAKVTPQQSKYNTKVGTGYKTINYSNSFYNTYHPTVTHYPSFWTFFWLNQAVNDTQNTSIKGVVKSKDGHNKLTIKAKDLGTVQVSVSKAQYAKAKVGKVITLK